jgi:cytoskeletal protein CcmA (bactofilin family)
LTEFQKIGKHSLVLKQIINQDTSDASKKDSAAAAIAGGKDISSPKPASSGAPKMSGNKNILSSDVEIKGTLKFSNDLIIDGRIEGEIMSEGDLTVGENANVKADIRTRSVTVFGKVQGNIFVTDRCELKQNAELQGDVTAGKLAIEEGATFMGSSKVGAAAKGMSGGKPAAPIGSNPAQAPTPPSGGGGQS